MIVGRSNAEHREEKFVGVCIYCGATEHLHDEHCIPESLNGFHVLTKASCQTCGNITSKFEGDYARDSVLAVRTAWKMRSKRSKKKRPTEFPMRIKKAGREETINVPVEDHYSLIPMIEVGSPGFWPSVVHPLGLKTGQCLVNNFRIRDDDHIDYLKEKYEAEEISVDFVINVNGFLRIIAKIAYCMTVWRYGLESIGENFVLPAILTGNNIEQWVGSDGQQEIHELAKDWKTDHIVMTGHTSDGELTARVKLFKNSPTPEYIVIVGQMKEGVHALYQSLGHV
jgi:hypothetical protein